MTFQGQGCRDHLCQERECGECQDDRFKPLLEFEFLDRLDSEMISKLRSLGWGVEMGDPAEHFDEYGDSLLHLAARQGEAQVMKVLLEMGAQANTCCQADCCCSPLMVACRFCHAACACVLLDHGADISLENSFGETALDQATNRPIGCDQDREAILSLFHERRQGKGCGDHVHCQAKCGDEDDSNLKPILQPEYAGKLEGAKHCELGWTPDKGHPAEHFDAARQGETLILKQLLEMGAQANMCCRAECCCSPLMVACRFGRPGCAALLLDNGADMNQENSFGETSLDQITNRPVSSERDRAVILALLHERAQGKGCREHAGCQKKCCGSIISPCRSPFQQDYLDMLDGEMTATFRSMGWAPDKGHPAEYFDEYGDSLLHVAARRGDMQAMQKLLDLGAHV